MILAAELLLLAREASWRLDRSPLVSPDTDVRTISWWLLRMERRSRKRRRTTTMMMKNCEKEEADAYGPTEEKIG
jgi:hypothetical protein